MNTQETAQNEKLTTSFLPLHKKAFGIATGSAAAVAMLLVTAVGVLRGPRPGVDLALLAQYFEGYSVSWQGALIGATWAGFTGFVMGWFLAFGRNLLLATLLIVVRTRAEFTQNRDFLDHI